MPKTDQYDSPKMDIYSGVRWSAIGKYTVQSPRDRSVFYRSAAFLGLPIV